MSYILSHALRRAAHLNRLNSSCASFAAARHLRASLLSAIQPERAPVRRLVPQGLFSPHPSGTGRQFNGATRQPRKTTTPTYQRIHTHEHINQNHRATHQSNNTRHSAYSYSIAAAHQCAGDGQQDDLRSIIAFNLASPVEQPVPQTRRRQGPRGGALGAEAVANRSASERMESVPLLSK